MGRGGEREEGDGKAGKGRGTEKQPLVFAYPLIRLI